MNKLDFAKSSSGRLVPTERAQWAFVPHPLPPELDFAPLAAPLGKASRLLGELDGIARTLIDPTILIRPLQAREALTSSSMEGTYTSLDDLLLVDAGASDTNRAPDTLEVVNYRRALTAAVASLSELPLSLRTLRDAHRTLLEAVRRHRGSSAQPGEFKTHQNFIGSREIESARFIPPPPDEALKALSDLEHFIHRDLIEIPDLIEAALIHYQFETIHPFADGNGRVGRMLIPLHLMVRGALRQPILYLSPTLEQRKDEYIDRMFDVSCCGKWTEWIVFFLDVVAEACGSAIATADRLLELSREYRVRASGAGRSSNLLTIVDNLFVRQAVTIPGLAEMLSVTYRSAQLNVETLIELGILTEFQGVSNPKFFMASGIRDAINQSL